MLQLSQNQITTGAKKTTLTQAYFDRKLVENYRNRLFSKDSNIDVQSYAVPIYRNSQTRHRKSSSFRTLREKSWYSNKPLAASIPSSLSYPFEVIRVAFLKVLFSLITPRSWSLAKTP